VNLGEVVAAHRRVPAVGLAGAGGVEAAKALDAEIAREAAVQFASMISVQPR
jgi:hypothetical protein